MVFKLDEVENERFLEWDEKHLLEHHDGVSPYSGAIGGRVCFKFAQTSIGNAVVVSCGHCKRSGYSPDVYECNITNYDVW